VPLLACPAVPQGRSNNTAGRASSATRPVAGLYELTAEESGIVEDATAGTAGGVE